MGFFTEPCSRPVKVDTQSREKRQKHATQSAKLPAKNCSASSNHWQGMHPPQMLAGHILESLQVDNLRQGCMLTQPRRIHAGSILRSGDVGRRCARTGAPECTRRPVGENSVEQGVCQLRPRAAQSKANIAASLQFSLSGSDVRHPCTACRPHVSLPGRSAVFDKNVLCRELRRSMPMQPSRVKRFAKSSGPQSGSTCAADGRRVRLGAVASLEKMPIAACEKIGL